MNHRLIPLIALAVAWGSSEITQALPPPDEIPEEVLRTEIIVEARSPLDGKLLSAAEYAELQAQLRERLPPEQVSPKVKELIFLLRLRELFQTISPF